MSETLRERIEHKAKEDPELGRIEAYASDLVEVIRAAETAGAQVAWQYGEPNEYGYYLTSWLDHNERPRVSEMWWGPNDKWTYHGHGIDPITVYAWMDRPQPAAPQPEANSDNK